MRFIFSRRGGSLLVGAQSDVHNRLEVVAPNPVYLAAVAEFGGSEDRMFAGLSFAAVGVVAQLIDGLVAQVRYGSIASYLTGMSAYLQATGAFPDDASVAAQWGTLAAGYSVAPSFEAGGVVAYQRLWNASLPLALVTAAGAGAWVAALSGDASARAYVASLFSEADANAVYAWLAALLESEDYAGAVLRGLGIRSSSWAEARGLQFSQGNLSRALGAGASLLPLRPAPGVVVAPELGAYAAAVGAPLDITADEANAFLDAFGDATLHAAFAAALEAGDYGAFAALSSTGLTSATADLYAAYLYAYLPRDLLLKGFVVGYARDWATASADPAGLREASLALRADGTGTFNSGLFTRRTLREVLFGYDDALFALAPAGAASRSSSRRASRGSNSSAGGEGTWSP